MNYGRSPNPASHHSYAYKLPKSATHITSPLPTTFSHLPLSQLPIVLIQHVPATTPPHRLRHRFLRHRHLPSQIPRRRLRNPRPLPPPLPRHHSHRYCARLPRRLTGNIRSTPRRPRRPHLGHRLHKSHLLAARRAQRRLHPRQRPGLVNRAGRRKPGCHVPACTGSDDPVRRNVQGDG